MDWLEVGKAPLYQEKRYDVCAKVWDAKTGKFEQKRFINVIHRARGISTPTGAAENWVGVSEGWFVTHFAPIPELPPVQG